MRDGRPADTARGGGIGRLYSVLWTHARGMRGRRVLAISMLVAAQVSRLAIPFLFGCAVNALQEQGRDGGVRAGGYMRAMLGAATAAWVLHGPARVIERRVALFARENLADALFARLLSLPLRWHEENHSGETLHRLQNTCSALCGFAQNQFIYLQNIVSIIGPIIALVAASTITGLTALRGYALIAVVLLRFDRVMTRLVREQNALERRYTATVVAAVANIGTLLPLGLAAPVRSHVRARHLELSVPMHRDFVVNEQKWAVVDVLNNALRV